RPPPDPPLFPYTTLFRSRGSLKIRSADPSVPPEIRINYLATETDRRAFIDGIRILRKILAAPALKSYSVGEVDPGAKVVSDDDLDRKSTRLNSSHVSISY